VGKIFERLLIFKTREGGIVTQQSDREKNGTSKVKKNGKIILVSVLIVALVVTGKYLGIQTYLRDALQWIQDLGILGIAIFMAIYILATVLFIPGSILTLGAGVIFGIGLGSLYVFVAATVGAIVAFLIGRYLARSWVESQIEGNQKFKAVDDAVAREGLKIVVLTRLSPFFPFNLLNYAFGVTRVSLRDYAIGCLGMLPGTIMYVYIGSLARLATIGTDAQNSTGAETAFKIVGAIVTIFGTIYVTRVASKALNSEISGD